MGRHWHDALEDALPPDAFEALPRGYDVIGDVVIVRLDEAARGFEDVIGEVLVQEVPPAETAAVDEGVVGRLRLRKVRVIGGEGDLVTVHKENGCRLVVDVEGSYFSPRLAHERARVAEQVVEGERVLDAYCGVGPYAVLLAKRGACVLGVDANPRAVELARENASRNKVQDGVDLVVGDARGVVPALDAGFDRVVMNLPHSAVEHLPLVLDRVKPGGRVHVGAMLAKDDAEEEAEKVAREHGVTLASVVSVRPYNPAVGHYTLDVDV